MNNPHAREIAPIVSQTATSSAIEHGPLAEMSQMAAVAAGRLQAPTPPSPEDLRLVLGILRGIENIGLVSFLRRHGTEEDYEIIGVSVAKRYTALPRRL